MIEPETLVSIEEPAPSAPAPAPTRNQGDVEVTEELTAAVQPTQSRLLGPWREHGLRIAPGDQCRLQVVPVAPRSNQFKVVQLTVTGHDAASTVLGHLGLVEPRDSEQSFLLTPLGKKSKQKIRVDDSTRIIAPPAWTGAKWRTIQAPPLGRLVKVVLPPPGSSEDPPTAQRVEVLSALQGVVDDRAIEAGTIQLRVAGFAEPVALAVPEATFPRQRLKMLRSGTIEVRLVHRPDQPVREVAVQISLSAEAMFFVRNNRVYAWIEGHEEFEVEGSVEEARRVQATFTWRENRPVPKVERVRAQSIMAAN